MEQIMQKPTHTGVFYNATLEDCHFNIWSGEDIKFRFYDKHSKEWNYPPELRKINWEPEPNKDYKVWWYCTNPADPADTGTDIIEYIEEYIKPKPDPRYEIIGKIRDKIYKMSLEQLKDLEQYIKN